MMIRRGKRMRKRMVMIIMMVMMCVCVRYGRAPNQPEAVAELSSAVHPVPPSLYVQILGPGDGGRGGH